MPYMTPERVITYVKKTPAILNTVLRGVTQEQAQQATDGPNGWSVVEVMCHLRDYEQIYYDRLILMLEQDNPLFPNFNQETLAKERNYASQNLRDAFNTYVETRRKTLTTLNGLTADQWQRTGQHPTMGQVTVLEQALQNVAHDVNHIEQITHTLKLSDSLGL
jgi:hypothetical protein